MRVAIIGAKGQLGTDLVRTFGEDPAFGVIPLTHADLDVTVPPETLKVLRKLKPNVIINTAAYVRWMMPSFTRRKPFKLMQSEL